MELLEPLFANIDKNRDRYNVLFLHDDQDNQYKKDILTILDTKKNNLHDVKSIGSNEGFEVFTEILNNKYDAIINLNARINLNWVEVLLLRAFGSCEKRNKLFIQCTKDKIYDIPIEKIVECLKDIYGIKSVNTQIETTQKINNIVYEFVENVGKMNNVFETLNKQNVSLKSYLNIYQSTMKI